jgi:putative transposase
MRRRRYTEEQILRILKEAEAGKPLATLLRTYGISKESFYRWRRKYGGMQLDEMKKMKALEEENRRLKKLVADLSLDKQALQDLVSRKW